MSESEMVFYTGTKVVRPGYMLSRICGEQVEETTPDNIGRFAGVVYVDQAAICGPCWIRIVPPNC